MGDSDLAHREWVARSIVELAADLQELASSGLDTMTLTGIGSLIDMLQSQYGKLVYFSKSRTVESSEYLRAVRDRHIEDFRAGSAK